jgi:bacteriocin-like protein
MEIKDIAINIEPLSDEELNRVVGGKIVNEAAQLKVSDVAQITVFQGLPNGNTVVYPDGRTRR